MAPFWGEEALAALVSLGRVRGVDGLLTGRKLVYPGRGSNPGGWNAGAMVMSHRPRARARSIFEKKKPGKKQLASYSLSYVIVRQNAPKVCRRLSPPMYDIVSKLYDSPSQTMMICALIYSHVGKSMWHGGAKTELLFRVDQK